MKSRHNKLQSENKAPKMTHLFKQKPHLDTSCSQNDAPSENMETIDNIMAPTTFPSTPTEAYELDYQHGGNIYWRGAIASEK